MPVPVPIPMTGEHGTGGDMAGRHPCPCSVQAPALPTLTQRPVAPRRRLRRRVPCHGGGVAGGRGEDAVHERQPRAAPQCPELPAGPAHAGRPRRPLQELRPVLAAAGFLERGDVRVLRAAAAPDGAGTAGAGLSPRRPGPPGEAHIDYIHRIHSIHCRSAGEQRSHRPGEGREEEDAGGGEARENGGFQRRVSRDGGKNVCWLSSRGEQHFSRAGVWAGGTKLRTREFPLFLTGPSNKSPLWGLITAWLRDSLPFWGVQGHCPALRVTPVQHILCHCRCTEQLPTDL
ncbi:uncharacterized protein LOC141727051 [Zonotrichia albicollis]|uniref:uncharacterized protein LOC141727051 n=1 Tax=Zonotrichia albicollis TaxID=44394 RepID=UPI003D810D26